MFVGVTRDCCPDGTHHGFLRRFTYGVCGPWPLMSRRIEAEPFCGLAFQSLQFRREYTSVMMFPPKVITELKFLPKILHGVEKWC